MAKTTKIQQTVSVGLTLRTSEMMCGITTANLTAPLVRFLHYPNRLLLRQNRKSNNAMATVLVSGLKRSASPDQPYLRMVPRSLLHQEDPMVALRLPN